MRRRSRTRLVAGAALLALVSACGGNTVVSPSQPAGSPPAPGTAASPGESLLATRPPILSSPPVETGGAAEEPTGYEYEEFNLEPGTHPHDVAPAPDGTVWFTGQAVGSLGNLDPASGGVIELPLPGPGSAPHGVIVGPDGAAWVTDQGANTIERVDPESLAVTSYQMPDGRQVGPHTATFDNNGILWFTAQETGLIGRLDPSSGEVQLFAAPEGPGPYGIDATPAGDVWYVSLAHSYLAEVDRTTGSSIVFEPPTAEQGARRVWSDSVGLLWVSEWNAGQLASYDPEFDTWFEWKLPGSAPQAYAVYVDDLDYVWVTDFGSNSILRFDAITEHFDPFPLPTANAEVRQLLGRPGELWGAESGADKLVVLRSSYD
jgi:virginiamycin B lyase